jgi:alcohol dehydrogenase class IV
MFPAPHGTVCARLLPIVMEVNFRALSQRNPQSPSFSRFDEVAQLLTGDPKAICEDAIYWLHEACDKMNIPPLGSYGITDTDLPQIAAQAKKASSMKGNPIELTDDELMEILEKAI